MRIIFWTCILALLVAVGPSGAEEMRGKAGKNLCLLNSDQCPDRKPTILELIAQLKAEIVKGEAVYTKEELQRLQGKLQEAEYLHWWLQYGE
jgi:hypothetical protein